MISINKQNSICQYTLTAKAIEVDISALGATILAVRVPDKEGKLVDVALGYTDAVSQVSYQDYIGATIGRCANRIAYGKFALGGKQYQLTINNGVNSLHGGQVGFDKLKWGYLNHTDNSVTLAISATDGEQGYPNYCMLSVTFAVGDCSLDIEYKATTDKLTICNPTNHTYFNLNGQDDGCILDNCLTIYADTYMPIDDQLIPTGQILDVQGTAFDFTSAKSIGRDISTMDSQLAIAGGYDHNYCVKGGLIATAYSAKTGIEMNVYTDRCGVQFYSGNFLCGNVGKSTYNKHAGFCLETQCYPNNVNNGLGDSVILDKGSPLYTKTTYSFGINNSVRDK